MMILIFQELKGRLEGMPGYAETHKVKIINNRSLSDSLSVSKNSIRIIKRKKE